MSKSKEQFMDMRQEEQTKEENIFDRKLRQMEEKKEQLGIPIYHEAPKEKETGLTLTNKKLQDLDKNGMDDMVRAIVDEVAVGNIDAMDNFLYFKKLEYLAKIGVENSKSYAYGKTYATKGNPYLRFGAKVEASATTSYDYRGCNDQALLDLEEEAKKATEVLKSRQKFLQSLTKPITLVDEETGDITTINPAVKLSSEGYKVTL